MGRMLPHLCLCLQPSIFLSSSSILITHVKRVNHWNSTATQTGTPHTCSSFCSCCCCASSAASFSAPPRSFACMAARASMRRSFSRASASRCAACSGGVQQRHMSHDDEREVWWCGSVVAVCAYLSSKLLCQRHSLFLDLGLVGEQRLTVCCGCRPAMHQLLERAIQMQGELG